MQERDDLWPTGVVEQLRKLMRKGLSATDIAKHLGNGFTRNAILGKARREGIPWPRTQGQRGPRKRAHPTSPPSLKVVEASAVNPIAISSKPYAKRGTQQTPRAVVTAPGRGPSTHPREVNVVATAITHPLVTGLPDALVKRAATQCGWPLGDPRTADFHYCQNERMAPVIGSDGKPRERIYCAAHAKAARSSAHTGDWYEERREWALRNPTTKIGKKVLEELARRTGA